MVLNTVKCNTVLLEQKISLVVYAFVVVFVLFKINGNVHFLSNDTV